MNRWPTRYVEEVCNLVRGSSPRPKSDSRYYGGPIPRLTIADITRDGWLVTPRFDSLTELGATMSRPVKAGTIVMAVSGNVGLCAELAVDACIHDGFVAFKDLRKDLFTPSFFGLAMSQMGATHERNKAGAIFQNITTSDVKAMPIPMPPLAEQERIVKLLDETDELRKLRAQADCRTADLIPALFDRMFGQRIAAPPVVTSTVGLKAPRDWRWTKLTEVARLATGHTPSRRHPEWWRGDIPWISLTDIRELDGTIATATSECVNEEGIANSSSVKLPKGTVCFSRTASVGFVTVMGREMATSQDFVNWVCGSELNPIFLMGALMQAREHLRSLASGSTHKTIYFPTVEQFATILPPPSLQKEFAARTNEIRAVQAKQAASRTRLDDLFQSMLQSAFNGEL